MKRMILALIACINATMILAQSQTGGGEEKSSKSPQQIEFENYYQEVDNGKDSLGKWWEKLSKEERETPANKESFEKGLRKFNEQAKQLSISFIKSHPYSMYSLEAVKKADAGAILLHPDVVGPLFDLLQDSIKLSKAGKELKERIEKGKRTAIGKQAPGFSLPDTLGHIVHLADYKGKYVLIDFWASWCKPCREENPNVLAAYNQYKDKNFTVLGISNDNDRGRWVKAIHEDAMPWKQVSELNGFMNKAARLYDIVAIPQNILIDPSGKIVAKNLRGKDLHKALENIFSGAKE